MSCEHKKFKAEVNVARLQESEGAIVSGYSADIKIKCADCDIDFEFVGLEAGLSSFGPRVSIDSTELRAPIKPATGQLIFHQQVHKLN